MSLLLGGLITLAVTALVQILIIPWVQRRNRRLERWEKEMIELVTLIDQIFPGKAAACRFALEQHSAIRDGAPLPNDVDRSAVLDDWTKVAHTSWAETLDEVTRMFMLARSVWFPPGRPSGYWAGLYNAVGALNQAVKVVNANPWGRGLELSAAELAQAWERINNAHDNLSAYVHEVSDPMKPPRTYPIRRARRWIKAQRGKVRELLGRRQAAIEPPSNSDTGGARTVDT